jgi:hypothetical protein
MRRFEHCPSCDLQLVPEALRCEPCDTVLHDPVSALSVAGRRMRERLGLGAHEEAFTSIEPVAYGGWPEVLPMQAALAMRGLPTVIPNEHTKLVAPHVTGGGNLYAGRMLGSGVELAAPGIVAAEARAEVGRMRAGAYAFDVPEVSPRWPLVEQLGRGLKPVAAAAVLVLFLPVTAVLLLWSIGRWLGGDQNGDAVARRVLAGAVVAACVAVPLWFKYG